MLSFTAEKMSDLDIKLANMRKRLDHIIHKYEFPEPTGGKISSDFNRNSVDMRTAGLDNPVTLPSTAHLKQRRREQPHAPKPYGEKVDISLIPLEGTYPVPIRSVPPLNPRQREESRAPVLHQSFEKFAPRHQTEGSVYRQNATAVPSSMVHKRSGTSASVNEYVQAQEKLNERIDAFVKATERRRAKDALRKARAAEAMETMHETMHALRERVDSKFGRCKFVVIDADVGTELKMENGTGKMVVEEEDADWTKVEAEEWVMVPKDEDY